ncbi:MAG: helix-turn-helix domain-containing protein [Clostridia bacterium]|nr:helix-turn-helix domain-containing protein [Clostridia bacterium]
MRKKFSIFTKEKREKLEVLCSKGVPVKDIAAELGYTEVSIYRELKRGTSTGGNKTGMTKYSAKRAEENARKHSSTKGASLKIKDDYEFACFLDRMITKGYTPTEIIKYIEQKNLVFKTQISRATLYNYVEQGIITSMVKKNNENKTQNEIDEYYIRLAMDEARRAEEIDEVPVGAVAVCDGRVIATAYNTRESDKCATHHAELLAIERACRALGGWRLPGVTLYVTMEPCAMCAGAIVNARIPRVVYGVPDLRFGAFGSLINLAELPLNHKPEIKGGVLAEENRSVLSAYFKRKREKR